MFLLCIQWISHQAPVDLLWLLPGFFLLIALQLNCCKTRLSHRWLLMQKKVNSGAGVNQNNGCDCSACARTILAGVLPDWRITWREILCEVWRSLVWHGVHVSAACVFRSSPSIHHPCQGCADCQASPVEYRDLVWSSSPPPW